MTKTYTIGPDAVALPLDPRRTEVTLWSDVPFATGAMRLADRFSHTIRVADFGKRATAVVHALGSRQGRIEVSYRGTRIRQPRG